MDFLYVMTILVFELANLHNDNLYKRGYIMIKIIGEER